MEESCFEPAHCYIGLVHAMEVLPAAQTWLLDCCLGFGWGFVVHHGGPPCGGIIGNAS